MMWCAGGFAMIHLIAVFAGLLCPGQHVLNDKSCVLREAICDGTLKDYLKDGYATKELLKLPVGEAVGGFSRIEKWSSKDGGVDMFLFKARRYPSDEFVVVLDRKTGVPRYADVCDSPSGTILYGDHVWYFLTDDHHLARWQPPYPPMDVLDLDSLRTRADGSMQWQAIDFSDSSASVPAPLRFEAATSPGSGDGAYEVFLDGKRLVSDGGAVFIRTERGH